MKSVERLAARLEREHQIKLDVRTFNRTRAGHWQRSAGAWSWYAYLVREENAGFVDIGSQFSVRQLLKAEKLEVGKGIAGIEIDPA